MGKVSGLLASLSGVALLFGAAACGDDGDGGGGSSGVSGSKTGSELTDADVKKLCEWSQGMAYEPSTKQVCTFFTAALSSDQASCEAQVKTCEEQASMQGDDEEDDEDDCSKATAKEDIPEGCKASVSEIEACLSAWNDLIKQQFSEASCADAGKDEDEADASEDLPAACKTVETKCPGFFDDDEDEDSGDGGDSDTMEFNCKDGSGTYTDFDQCDGIEDCKDASDEADC